MIALCIKTRKRGDSFIGIIFQFSIIMSLIFCFVNFWKPFIHKQNMDYIAKTLVRAVEANGRIDADITSLANQLKQEFNMNPSITWTADYIAGTNKIQIRKRFTLTVRDNVSIKLLEPSFSSPVAINIPLEKKFVGVSQVYWK